MLKLYSFGDINIILQYQTVNSSLFGTKIVIKLSSSNSIICFYKPIKIFQLQLPKLCKLNIKSFFSFR